MKINIAILEDNEIHYKELYNIINNWAIKNGHTTSIYWFQNESSILNSELINTCDLLFSDIELCKHSNNTPNICTSNGIDICSKLRKNKFHGDIIFLTAYREYVFEGYHVQAVNYLLKPVSEEAINNCINNYISMHNADFYYLHKNNDIIRIPYNDIISISKSGHDCCITTLSALYTERSSLQNIEKHLPEQFIRCHKSCIINLNYITSLSGSTIKLSNKQTQPVGRFYLDNIKKALLKLVSNTYL